MKFSLDDLKKKEVIDISSGERLGFIDDAELDLEKSSVEALLIYGRQRFFGIFGREENIVIQCSDIRVVGNDVILVRLSSRQELSHSINNERKGLKSPLK